MSQGNGKLRTEDLELLDMLGAAATDDTDFVAFEYLTVERWPFAWLVHPRLVGEARVVDLESFARLEVAGCVLFTVDDPEHDRRYAMLTYEGMTRYLGRQGQTVQDPPQDRQGDVAANPGSPLA